ncbi:MAG: cold-shock protein [Actinomycetota bacterium]
MATGTIKWFNLEKGFGFISRPDGADIFVHSRAIDLPGYHALDTGQPVEFEITETPTGPQAINVRPLGPVPR